MNYYSIPGIKLSEKAAQRNTVEAVISKFCLKAKVDFDFVATRTRKRNVLELRQALTYYLRKYTNATLLHIAGLFEQDHTTVINTLHTVSNLMDTDPLYRKWLASLDPNETIIPKLESCQ